MAEELLRGVNLQGAAAAALKLVETAPSTSAEAPLADELAVWVRHCLRIENALTNSESKSHKQAALLRRLGGNTPLTPSDISKDQFSDSDASYDGSKDRSMDRRMPAGRLSPLVGNHGKAVAGPNMIRLLLVEDDPFQADAILVLCEQCGYHAQVSRRCFGPRCCMAPPAASLRASLSVRA